MERRIRSRAKKRTKKETRETMIETKEIKILLATLIQKTSQEIKVLLGWQKFLLILPLRFIQFKINRNHMTPFKLSLCMAA